MHKSIFIKFASIIFKTATSKYFSYNFVTTFITVIMEPDMFPINVILYVSHIKDSDIALFS